METKRYGRIRAILCTVLNALLCLIIATAPCSHAEPIDGLNETDAWPHGLIADYYHFDTSGMAFADYVSSRIVSMPYFQENKASRKADTLEAVGFVNDKAVRYSGRIRFPEDGLFVLSAQCSHGIRVWIDDVPVIDNWKNTSTSTITGKAFQAKKDSLHDIQIEYYSTAGEDRLVLFWRGESASTPALIASEYFYLPDPETTSVDAISMDEHGELSITGSHLDRISSLSVVPYSLSSAREPVVCEVSVLTGERATAKPASPLPAGTYRVSYTSDDRVFRTACSFVVNADGTEAASRQEHPRPDKHRDDWINLNGAWSFDFDPMNAGEAEEWYGTKAFSRLINVPFPWQADVSWIGNDTYYGYAWYKRPFTIDADWLEGGRRCFLCFGAVDAEAVVYVNGVAVGCHRGGYTPFEFDITDCVHSGDNTVAVRVYDEGRYRNDQYPALLGKQGYEVPCGYAPTSGIWQTVYLERRSASFVQGVRVNADVDCPEEASSFHIADARLHFDMRIHSDREQDVELRFDFSGTLWDRTENLDIDTGSHFFYSMTTHLQEGENHVVTPEISFPNARLWSDVEPNLYEGAIEIHEISGAEADVLIDRLDTYFGIRKIEAKACPGRDYQSIHVNGRPVFLSGVLDQGFWGGGGYTAPSEASLRDDIEFLKSNGFNMMRKHLKIEDPLQYYWCDKLGLYLMQDMPFATGLNATANGGEAPGRELFEAALEDLLERDYNHPSLISIHLFNETWGIDKPGLKASDGMTTELWQKSLYEKAKALDSQILIEDMSTVNEDHIQPTDLNSFHAYPASYAAAKKTYDRYDEGTAAGNQLNFRNGYLQTGAPWMNSEYGGVGAHAGDLDVSYCFKYQTDLLRQHEKLCGFVYTEAYDVEYERNGLRTFDRKDKVFAYDEIAYGNDMHISDLTQPEYIGFNIEPVVQRRPSSEFSVEIVGMNWSSTDYGAVTLKWTLEGTDSEGNPFGGELSPELRSETQFPYPRYTRSSQTVSFVLPNVEGVATLTAWLEKDGRKIAKNFTNILLRSEESPAPYSAEGDVLYLTGSATERGFDGAGEIVVDFSESLSEASSSMSHASGADGGRHLEKASFIFELSSAKGDRIVDGIRHSALSQTTLGDELPSDVILCMDGIPIDSVQLKDDYRDMRGTVSLTENINGGTSAGDFGDLVRIDLDDSLLSQLEAKMASNDGLRITLSVSPDSDHANGLKLYDHSSGRYLIDPLLMLVYAENDN